MKKATLFLLTVVLSVSVRAQIKSAAQMISYAKMTFSAAEAQTTKSYWKQFETGKMDSLTYVRWIPKVTDANNSGDNIMCFYKKKNMYVDYIMFQTIKKNIIENFKKEALTLGYKVVESSNKPDMIKVVYSNGDINLSFVEGRERKTDATSYMIGVKVMKR